MVLRLAFKHGCCDFCVAVAFVLCCQIGFVLRVFILAELGFTYYFSDGNFNAYNRF